MHRTVSVANDSAVPTTDTTPTTDTGLITRVDAMNTNSVHSSMRICMILLCAALLMFSACAAGPNESVKTTNASGEIDGFLDGIWHGFIAPVAFVVSLFTDRVNIYEVHNNGNWYDFGFMLGASITVFGGCGGSAASQRKRKRRCCEDKDESKD